MTRLVLAVAIAAAAVLPATADAVVICVKPDPDHYVCKDTGNPGCYAYGRVGDAAFGVGDTCGVG